MVNGIEHVAVVSKDTAALKDWYMEMYIFSSVCRRQYD